MSYKVTLWDKTELILPDNTGYKLKEHWLHLSKPAIIEINGNAYSSSQIASITKYNETETDINLPLLSMGKVYNCAPHSLQLAIQRYAVAHKEIKKLSNENYREKVRQLILAKYPNKQWCDIKTGNHACLEEKVAKT